MARMLGSALPSRSCSARSGASACGPLSSRCLRCRPSSASTAAARRCPTVTMRASGRAASRWRRRRTVRRVWPALAAGVTLCAGYVLAGLSATLWGIRAGSGCADRGARHVGDLRAAARGHFAMVCAPPDSRCYLRVGQLFRRGDLAAARRALHPERRLAADAYRGRPILLSRRWCRSLLFLLPASASA